jgi:thiol-disulfide isomerase/thioredoxin
VLPSSIIQEDVWFVISSMSFQKIHAIRTMKSLSQNWTLFSILLLLVSGAWVWSSAALPGGTTNGRIPAPRVGFLAPAFSLETLEGQPVSLADFAGRPVLINLWASWCPPCRAEMPAIERVYDEFKDQGLVILAINATHQDNQNAARAFVEDLELAFPVLLDRRGEVSAAYELRALPTSFFIDGQGIVRDVVVGEPMSDALLHIRVQQLFEQRD